MTNTKCLVQSNLFWTRSSALATGVALKLALAVVLLALPSTRAMANSSEDELDYDSIVSELSSQRRTQSAARSKAVLPARRMTSLDDVLFHAGVGVSNMFGELTFPDGGRTYLNQRGFQATLGIDLLSAEWIAEGSVRSFSDGEYARNGVSVREFDLKVVYRPRLTDSISVRLAGGLAARYMTVDRGVRGITEYTTPASVGALGIDYAFTSGFTIGADASARSSLVNEGVDQLTYDATLRVDAHF